MRKHVITPIFLWVLYGIAAFTFVFALFYPYVGEEGTYTISSLEMWMAHKFIIPTLYGLNYTRPPFYNWLIIPLANAMGWIHMLIAARIVAISSTVLTGLVLAWFVKKISNENLLAALAAIIFFSCDTLFYRGWLAYADPLFSLCIFSSIAFLWAGVDSKKTYLIWMAIFAVSCGMLTKVSSAYIFYVTALATLMMDQEYRKVILSWNSLLAHFAAVVFYLVWVFLIAKNATPQIQLSTMQYILFKLGTFGSKQYFLQLLYFPIETFLRLLPASGVVLYLWVKDKTYISFTKNRWVLPALIIVLVNWAPYWLGPQSGIRYIMPIYPLIALLLAYFIFEAGEKGISLMVKWFVVLIILKLIFSAWLMPFYEDHFRGHYHDVAQDILNRAHDKPLYVADGTAQGESVTANIDAMIYPQAPITYPPVNFTKGYVFSFENNAKWGTLISSYKVGGKFIYLFYHGGGK